MSFLKKLWPIYIANLFFSLHYAATLYVNSTFLNQFFSVGTVSLLFVAGACGNIALVLSSPRIIDRYGGKRLFVLLLVLLFVALTGLLLAPSGLVVAFSFFIYSSVTLLVYYCLDLFLEEFSRNNKTGEIRGAYLTVGNISIAAAPLIVASLAIGDNLIPVYLAALILLLPVIALAVFAIRTKHHSITHQSFNLPIRYWWHTNSLRRVTLARFVLEFFFALMVIYTPLYLHEYIGFGWNEIGVIFTIMLLPFILLEWPVGELADRRYGEKELMTGGFFIAGSSLLIMPFIPASFVVWTLVLFTSRVGASLIEVTTESYFFKHIDARDTSMIGIFRLTRPISIIAGSIVGMISISFLPFPSVFLVLALVVFFGMKESLYLKDTL